MTLPIDNPYLVELADEHRQWLAPFDPRYLVNWEKSLNGDIEAAMCEAGVRRRLQSFGVSVEPNERLTGDCGGPDFRCTNQAACFYVEATCIKIETAVKKTKIKHEPERAYAPFKINGMTQAIFNKCGEKTPQCADLDAPVLVAIGTFHPTAAMAGFTKVLVRNALTGKTGMAWDVSMETGQPVGDTYQVTNFGDSAFLQRDIANEVGFKRRSISGVVVLGLGTPFRRSLGVLHPNPVRPFNPSVLPDIEFCKVRVNRDCGRLDVSWVGGRDD